MILLIDNYDSFAFNLARYFQRMGQEVRVVRNDAITVSEVRKLNPAAIVLSPGPCSPSEAGVCVPLVGALAGRIPILGICLGHQAIAAALGGQVGRAAEPVHGQDASMVHSGTGILAGIPNPTRVGRYHSLVAMPDSLPETLVVDGSLADGTIMAVHAKNQCVHGLQFHPESILTECGFQILANFLSEAGIGVGSVPDITSELRQVSTPQPVRPDTPIPY